MNKEVKFSRFVGIAVVIICVWIVVLALMSAITKNQNNDNMIDVDEGTGITLSVPKSNIISDYIDTQKDVTSEKGKVEVKVRLPKLNMDTSVAKNINERIYSLYQDTYAKILNTNNIQKIDIDYDYEYINHDTVIKITVITKATIDSKTESQENKFFYDLKNDEEFIDKNN